MTCPHSRAFMDALIAQGACPGCLVEEHEMLRARLDRMHGEREQLVSGLRDKIDVLYAELVRRESLRQNVILIPKEMFDV